MVNELHQSLMTSMIPDTAAHLGTPRARLISRNASTTRLRMETTALAPQTCLTRLRQSRTRGQVLRRTTLSPLPLLQGMQQPSKALQKAVRKIPSSDRNKAPWHRRLWRTSIPHVCQTPQSVISLDVHRYTLTEIPSQAPDLPPLCGRCLQSLRERRAVLLLTSRYSV